MDAREDGLLMSGIQHFAFCRRQWALIHIEQQWQENARTAQGQLDHVRCHDETLSEKRDNVFTVRGMRVFSRKLNLSGACDVVEFHKDKNGISLEGQPGFWLPYPIEYKHGREKETDADRLQLCAEAMALEEMLVCDIPAGALYYIETRRREVVPFTEELRRKTEDTAAGKKRLRKVAKKCVDHGQRVQNSVFECLLTAAQYVTLKAELTALIEPETDSLRFYRLGNQYKQNVEHIGVQPHLRAGFRPAHLITRSAKPKRTRFSRFLRTKSKPKICPF